MHLSRPTSTRFPHLLGCLSALVFTVPGAGQEPDSIVLGDSLRVTILRGPTTLDRAPFAVTTLRGRDLQLGNSGLSLEEAVQGIPGLQLQNRFNYSVGERISIRGFGARAQFGVRGIRVLVDGIPATLPDGQATLDHLDLGSLGTTEVLRGPASALYGNGGGGVLSFSTADPSAEPVSEEAGVVLGDNGLSRFQSTTSGTVDEWGYLLNVARFTYDGFRPNPTTEADDLYGQARRWNVNARVTRDDVWGGKLALTGNFVDLGAENPGSISRSTLDEGSVEARGFNVAQGSRKDVRQGQFGAAWSGPLGSLQGDVAGWGVFREIDNPIPPRFIDLERAAWGVRAFVGNQNAATTRRFTWTGGAEVEMQRDDRQNWDNDGGARGELTLDQFETVSSLGVFARGELRVARAVSAMGALRYDRFSFRAEDRFLEGGDASGSREMGAFSPSIGLHVTASETLSVYANVSTALNTPTTTELANRPGDDGGFDPDLDPSRGVTGELGARAGWAHVSFEANAWVTALQDELVPFEDEAQPGRTFFRNAGSSDYNGFETAVSAGGRHWSGRLSYTFIDASYETYSVEDEIFDGNRVPGVSRHHLDGLLRAESGRWYGEIRGDYVGSVPVDDANSDAANPYALFDLRTGLEGIRWGRTRIGPFIGVQNVLDRSYIAAITVNAFGARYFEPGPGRAFYGGISLAFW